MALTSRSKTLPPTARTTVAFSTLLCIAVVLHVCCTHITLTHADKLYPCAFVDTINITGSYHYDSNDSYLHDDVIIPRHLIAEYDFVMHHSDRVPVPKHIRACVCMLKPCIRFCCKRGHIYDTKKGICNATTTAGAAFNVIENFIEVRAENGSTSALVETTDLFSLQIGVPCHNMRFVTKDNKVLKWNIFPNGTISRKNHVFSRHYCLTPFKGENSSWEWQPLACTGEKLRFILGVMEWTYAICLIIAVICFILIFLIYAVCNQLRNTFYGVAIQAHALGIILGYSLMAHLILTDPAQLSKTACIAIPRFVVLFLVLCFYILSYISFNFYLHFHGIVLTKLMFWLIFVPVVLLAIGWSFFVSLDHYAGKAVLGGDPCWFDPRNWSIMIYFFTPILISFAISGFFYIITLIHLNERSELEVNKLLATIEENRFKSFWKYFGYNFAAWLAFIVVFILNYYRQERTHISYGGSFFVAFQGFGALYTLIGKNQQVQNWLRSIENEVEEEEEDDVETSVPMTNF